MKKKYKSQHRIGTYCMRPDDQPIVRITFAVFSWFGWKHMNDACSFTFRLPLTKNAGDMLTVIRSMVVLNTATFDELLNKTAMNLPNGSQQTLCGMPPTSFGPQFAFEKSAIGNDCFGAVAAAKKKINSLKSFSNPPVFVRTEILTLIQLIVDETQSVEDCFVGDNENQVVRARRPRSRLNRSIRDCPSFWDPIAGVPNAKYISHCRCTQSFAIRGPFQQCTRYSDAFEWNTSAGIDLPNDDICITDTCRCQQTARVIPLDRRNWIMIPSRSKKHL